MHPKSKINHGYLQDARCHCVIVSWCYRVVLSLSVGTKINFWESSGVDTVTRGIGYWQCNMILSALIKTKKVAKKVLRKWCSQITSSYLPVPTLTFLASVCRLNKQRLKELKQWFTIREKKFSLDTRFYGFDSFTITHHRVGTATMGMLNLRIAAVLALSLQTALAFSTGAGGCDEGPAVGGFHRSRPVTTGQLSDGLFEVLLNGVALDPSTLGSFNFGETKTLNLRATGQTGFLGYLLRLDLKDDDTFALTPDESGQISNFCQNQEVSSVTHINPQPKTFVTADLDTTVFTELQLDVTVVVRNQPGSSIYYHSRFMIRQANPGHPPCEVCGENKRITNPDRGVSFPGQPLFTCAEVEEAGIEGFVNATYCPSVSVFLNECGCEVRPTPSQPPNPGFEPCEVCGEGMAITNPFGSVIIPGQPIFTCAEVAEAGLIGFLDPDICPALRGALDECDCAPATPSPSPPPTSNPTSMPVMPDTPAPTDICGGRNAECTRDFNCCSGSCQSLPGRVVGQCLSSKSVSKAVVKLGGGRGGAGSRAKR